MKRNSYCGCNCCSRGIASQTALTGTLPSLGSFIDDKLNEHSYIVPGLGDAGDLKNYNWEKSRLLAIRITKVPSPALIFLRISIWLVAIIAKGATVKATSHYFYWPKLQKLLLIKKKKWFFEWSMQYLRSIRQCCKHRH
jgi:hypothetical protein